MSGLLTVIAFALVASVLSLVGGVLLLVRERPVRQSTDALAAFAAGILLSFAFFDLLPDAIARERGAAVVPWALFGFVLFFLLERAVLLFHARHGCENAGHTQASTPLIVVGDTVHKFLDGIVIGGTFVIDVPLGIATSMAVAAHEVPHEIGDFAVLLHNGMKRSRVLAVNILTAMGTVAGAVATWSAGEQLTSVMPHFLSITAGFFTYIAAVDLIPELHHEMQRTRAMVTTIAFLAGIAGVPLVSTFVKG